MKKEISYGVIPVFKEKDGTYRYLIVQENAGHWSFPKGHPEAGETGPETAMRELQEETGIASIKPIENPYFELSYTFTKNNEQVHKTARHYIAFVGDTAVTPQEEEIADWLWSTYEEAFERLFPNSVEAVLTPAHQYLTS